jgi:hypothetical protein
MGNPANSIARIVPILLQIVPHNQQVNLNQDPTSQVRNLSAVVCSFDKTLAHE